MTCMTLFDQWHRLSTNVLVVYAIDHCKFSASEILQVGMKSYMVWDVRQYQWVTVADLPIGWNVHVRPNQSKIHYKSARNNITWLLKK